jgi:hypothetical protein
MNVHEPLQLFDVNFALQVPEGQSLQEVDLVLDCTYRLGPDVATVEEMLRLPAFMNPSATSMHTYLNRASQFVISARKQSEDVAHVGHQVWLPSVGYFARAPHCSAASYS